MPQVIDFPTLGGDRAQLPDYVRVAKELPAAGEPFKEFRARLRAAKIWDRERPIVPLRFLGAGGATVVPSKFMQALAAARNDDEVNQAVLGRLWELNPILFKTIFELFSQRPYGKDEIYKFLGSHAFRGTVPSRPALEAWIQLAVTTGLVKAVGIAITPGPSTERWAKKVGELSMDELLAEDAPLADPAIPDDAVPAEPAASAPQAITSEPTAQVIAQVTTSAGGAPLPPALRHLIEAASLASPRGRARPVPPSRFAGGFSDEIKAETGERLAAWWREVKPSTHGFTPQDFALDPEAWVEGADEVLYRVAVAAALAFRLDTDRNGVLAAFKALEQAGVLGDL